MDGKCKQPYTIRGTGRFAISRSQGSEAEQTNRGHLEAAAGQAGACNGWPPNSRPSGSRSAPGLAECVPKRHTLA